MKSIKFLAVLIIAAMSVMSISSCNTPDPAPVFYKVGQQYGGGIVCYVDGTQQHGLVAIPYDINHTQWCSPGNYITGGDLDSLIGYGSTNTSILIQRIGVNVISAASVAKGVNVGGYGDWYLPSKGEMMVIAENSRVLNLTDSLYWTSNDLGADHITLAWVYNAKTNTFIPYSKGAINVSLRAIRTF